MEILGYGDRLSVRAGETIRFMVSTDQPTYRADVIRFDRAFRHPDFERDTIVPTAINAEYDGRFQKIYPGSYVAAPAPAGLSYEDGFTVQAWVCPSLLGRDWIQGIAGHWNPGAKTGFVLGIDPSGRLTLAVGDGTESRVTADGVLTVNRWYFVSAVYDPASGTAALSWTELNRSWLTGQGNGTSGKINGIIVPDATITIGATNLEQVSDGRNPGTGRFNGKIDRPRIWSRPLSRDELARLAEGGRPEEIARGLVAAWDFSEKIHSDAAVELGPFRLDGKVVNSPGRGVTGANWTGQETNFRLAPDQYGAIAFHEDDIDDAGWQVDFELPVPADLSSGIYGIRLMAGDACDYVPFYVRPALGASTNRVLFLAPTNTYLAYANERLHHAVEADPEFVAKCSSYEVVLGEREAFIDAHPELESSLYDLHPDGNGVCYSSRLRPVYSMRPQFLNWLNGFPRHFAADLFLIEWLDNAGIPYDVATDEDLHVEGEQLVSGYKVFMTGGHPEYWTSPMLDSLESYLSGGGRMMYLGGNGFYWVTGINDERPHVVEIRRGINGTRSWTSHPGEIYLSTTGEQGGLWRYRGRGPNRLTGIGFASEGWGGAAGYVRLPDSHDPRAAFVFEGIGDDEIIGEFGMVMDGAAGDEIDRVDYALGTPAETLRLATSELRHTDYYQVVVEDMNWTLPGRGGTEDPRVRADMTLLERENGSAVFSTGSINWIGSLPSFDFQNNVARITENVLRHFAEI